VFPDGAEFLRAPVTNWDVMVDLAVIGPLETDASPLPLVDGEALAVGNNVYLIGYPGEREKFPQPTLSRGLISRLREWPAAGITYFQSDATIAGGQSGGALASAHGEVIGISGFRFTDGDFALVASAADLGPRVQSLAAGESPDPILEPLPPMAGGARTHQLLLMNDYDDQVFVVNKPAGTVVDLGVTSDNDTYIRVIDTNGYSVTEVDDEESGTESAVFTIETPGPHFVIVGQSSPSIGSVWVSSSQPLIEFPDFDDGRGIVKGQTRVGYLGYPGDVDTFTLTLMEGQKMNVSVDSVLLDPYLLVLYPDGSTVEDDDGGGGLFGTNAELTFIAPDAGRYTIVVFDATFNNLFGGYFLRVAEAERSDPTPVAPSLPMDWYFNSGYAIKYPSNWEDVSGDEDSCPVEWFLCFANAQGNFLYLFVEDLTSIGPVTQPEYVDSVIEGIEELSVNYELESRETLVTSEGGLSVEVLTYIATSEELRLKARRLIYVDQEKHLAFNAVFLSLTGRFDAAFEALMSESINSFQAVDE
ncbi:MAG: serine protease, partial [Chloroflexota bacterium]